MSMHTSPPQSAVLILPSPAELSQRNTEAAQLWRKISRIVDIAVQGDGGLRHTLLAGIEQARNTAIESAAYFAALDTPEREPGGQQP